MYSDYIVSNELLLMLLVSYFVAFFLFILYVNFYILFVYIYILLWGIYEVELRFVGGWVVVEVIVRKMISYGVLLDV